MWHDRITAIRGFLLVCLANYKFIMLVAWLAKCASCEKADLRLSGWRPLTAASLSHHKRTALCAFLFKQRKKYNKTHQTKLQSMASQAQVIRAPARPQQTHRLSIFLGGTASDTGEPDWRDTLNKGLADQAVAIFDPKRDDWDSTWREDFSDTRWADQIQWELDMQDTADIIVVLFHGVTAAPISLAEMGMAARTGKLIACALDGYCKKGYVEAVCRKFKAPFVRSEDELRRVVMERLGELRAGRGDE